MFRIVLFVLLSLVCLSSQTAVQDAFKRHGIVPDVVPVAPEKLLKVVYENNKEVTLGIELKPSGWSCCHCGDRFPNVFKTFIYQFLYFYFAEVQNDPVVQWEAEKGDLYTLIVSAFS